LHLVGILLTLNYDARNRELKNHDENFNDIELPKAQEKLIKFL